MTAGNGGSRKQRLELTWIGKDERPRLEPRILLPVDEHSHTKGKPGDGGIHDNILIQGDNLLALKSLEQEFAGKVRCIFIDPPYNTGTAFEQYDDGLEHSLWLSLIRDRLELLHRLLAQDGSIWITIDDSECHYLKIVLDEVFGRANFVGSVVWEKDKGGRGDAELSNSHDYVLIFAKNKERWKGRMNLLARTETQLGRFKNPDNDPRGPWRQGDDGTAKSGTEKQRFPIKLPSGRIVRPKEGRFWAFSEETFRDAEREGRAYFGRSGDSLPIIKRYLSEVRDGVAPRSWWSGEEVGTNQAAKRDHLRKLLPDIEPFATPKPEGLLARILEIASNPGELVLDSFAGSGTTGAVAHKMGRRWIMVELGDHAHTHIVPRLRKVIDGEDPGGVTEAVGWEGGGGFRFYKLAPSLIESDQFGQKVISKQYDEERLAEAMCKHMNFTFIRKADRSVFWQHGYSSETDFIHIIPGAVTHDGLKALSHEVGSDRSLLVCCKAFRAKKDAFANLTIAKIPQAVLDNCEWGRDDYSLNIAKPAEDAANEPDDGPDDDSNGGEPAPRRRGQPRGTPEPETPVLLAPMLKAPLKMDGTTRQRSSVTRSASMAALPATPPPIAAQHTLAAKTAAKAPVAASKPPKATAKRGRPAKQEAVTKPRAKDKKPNGKRAADTKAAAKAKSRRPADDRQGRLL